MAGTSVEDFARRMATLPATIVEVTPEAVRGAAVILEREVDRGLAAASGGDSRLSRVRSGKGAKIGADVKVTGAGRRAEGRVVPVGPVMLIEEDTRAHVEPFQYLAQRTGGARSYSMARRRKAKRSGFIYIPGVGVRSRARHPGTRGKHPIRDAFTAAADEAGEAGLDVFADAIRKHLGR